MTESRDPLAFLRNVSTGAVEGLTVPLAIAAGLAGARAEPTFLLSMTGAMVLFCAAGMTMGSYFEMRKASAERPVRVAGTIGCSYLLGAVVVLLPFALLATYRALTVAGITVILLLAVAGYVNGVTNEVSGMRSAIRTAIAGFLAATAAFLVGSLFS